MVAFDGEEMLYCIQTQYLKQIKLYYFDLHTGQNFEILYCRLINLAVNFFYNFKFGLILRAG